MIFCLSRWIFKVKAFAFSRRVLKYTDHIEFFRDLLPTNFTLKSNDRLPRCFNVMHVWLLGCLASEEINSPLNSTVSADRHVSILKSRKTITFMPPQEGFVGIFDRIAEICSLVMNGKPAQLHESKNVEALTILKKTSLSFKSCLLFPSSKS